MLLNGCSIYAVHFSQQEIYDRKLYPISVDLEERSSESPQHDADIAERVSGDPDHRDAAAEWGDLAEGGSDATSAEGRRRRREELIRMQELEAMAGLEEMKREGEKEELIRKAELEAMEQPVDEKDEM